MAVSGSYLSLLQALLPRGRAWPRAASAWLTKLLDALAQEFERVEQRVQDLLQEYDPRTANELLGDWERVAGLPGDWPVPGTLDGRRRLLHGRMTVRLGQSKQAYLDLAWRLGYEEVTIKTYQVFVAGSSVGQPLTQTPWRFAFTMQVLYGANDPQLEAVIRFNAQAHTHVLFEYS